MSAFNTDTNYEHFIKPEDNEAMGDDKIDEQFTRTEYKVLDDSQVASSGPEYFNPDESKSQAKHLQSEDQGYLAMDGKEALIPSSYPI